MTPDAPGPPAPTADPQVPPLLPSPEQRRYLRPLLWAAVAVFAAAVLAFITEGADGPADPFLASAAASTVDGFDEIGFRIDDRGGGAREHCALLADDEASRRQGMKGRGDLAGYDGMLFAYPEEVVRSFTMETVPIALSIAFFDDGGTFVGAVGMAPCPEGGDCPLYDAPAPFRWALEVPEGALPSLGVGEGARLTVGGPCSPA